MARCNLAHFSWIRREIEWNSQGGNSMSIGYDILLSFRVWTLGASPTPWTIFGVANGSYGEISNLKSQKINNKQIFVWVRKFWTNAIGSQQLSHENAYRLPFVFWYLNLSFGIFIQYQYWDKMPLWYHLPFLAMLVPGIILGGILGKGRKVVN